MEICRNVKCCKGETTTRCWCCVSMREAWCLLRACQRGDEGDVCVFSQLWPRTIAYSTGKALDGAAGAERRMPVEPSRNFNSDGDFRVIES